jgi:hypothetical protein
MDENSNLDPNYEYSMKELAFIWNVSSEWVRRRFRNEPGVFRLQEVPTPGKRQYCPLRIPGRVAMRVRSRTIVVGHRN